MPINLYRIDDRLIHGQVIAGWCYPLNVKHIVLVDDAVAETEWEQELYRMGVPPGMSITFTSVDTAIRDHQSYANSKEVILLLTGSVETTLKLVKGVPDIKQINLGGVHHKTGRIRKLRYVFLTPEEERGLREIAEAGVTVTAQDVPTAKPLSLQEVLSGDHAA